MDNETINNEETAVLWRDFLRGDIVAWSRLLETHYRTLFNYGRRLTEYRDLLHDGIQELFLTLWDNRANLNPNVSSVSFYLLRAYRNLLIKEFKNKKRFQPETKIPTETSSSPSFEQLLIDREGDRLTSSRVKHLLGTLSSREQEALFLKYYQNLSNQEIAEMMSIRRQSVANLLHSGLQHLRQRWQAKFGASLMIGFLWYFLQS